MATLSSRLGALEASRPVKSPAEMSDEDLVQVIYDRRDIVPTDDDLRQVAERARECKCPQT